MPYPSPSSPVVTGPPQDDVLRAVVAAQKTLQQRRSQRRLPFFCPVMLGRDAEGLVRMPAYIRDVSTDGIGLLHTTPLSTNDRVTAFLQDDPPLRLPIRILWCQSLSNEWYLSGGTFENDGSYPTAAPS